MSPQVTVNCGSAATQIQCCAFARIGRKRYATHGIIPAYRRNQTQKALLCEIVRFRSAPKLPYLMPNRIGIAFHQRLHRPTVVPRQKHKLLIR